MMNPSRYTRTVRDGVALALAASLAQFALAPSARAQVGSPGVVIAEKLFREGQHLLEQAKGDVAKVHVACEKFAESERLRPAMGTLLNLAVCHEKENRTASAWAEYNEVAGQASRAGQADRSQFASQHAAALEHQLCRLRLEMSAPPPGVEVKIDGQVLGTAVWGTDLPLDPGAHTLVVSAPGRQSWSRNILLGPDKTMDREEVPALLGPDGAPVAPVPAPVAVAALRPDAPPAQPAGNGRATTGYIIGGVGVAALAVGGVFLGRGVAYESRSSDESKKATGANYQTFTDASNSDSSAGTANLVIGAVAGGVGIAGAVVGLYLILSHPASEAPAKAASLHVVPSVGPGHAGATFGFDF
jgi:hypothetical protein